MAKNFWDTGKKRLMVAMAMAITAWYGLSTFSAIPKLPDVFFKPLFGFTILAVSALITLVGIYFIYDEQI